jgi:mannose-6-phosphate isomerase-like protein (cupin superfamily)
MKSRNVSARRGFHVLIGNRRSQAAAMNLAPGGAEGGPRNRHRGADQWLFVIAGVGQAIVGRKTWPLRAGTLVLIEHGQQHEIRNTGRSELRTLNFYSPPAFTRSGNELPAGKP